MAGMQTDFSGSLQSNQQKLLTPSLNSNTDMSQGEKLEGGWHACKMDIKTVESNGGGGFAICGGRGGWGLETEQKGTSPQSGGALSSPWASGATSTTVQTVSSQRLGNVKEAWEGWGSRHQGGPPAASPRGRAECAGQESSPGVDRGWLGPEAAWPGAQTIASFCLFKNFFSFKFWIFIAAHGFSLVQRAGVWGLLIAVASLVLEHGLQGMQASVAVDHRL